MDCNDAIDETGCDYGRKCFILLVILIGYNMYLIIVLSGRRVVRDFILFFPYCHHSRVSKKNMIILLQLLTTGFACLHALI